LDGAADHLDQAGDKRAGAAAIGAMLADAAKP
jgi:hypothetical protein